MGRGSHAEQGCLIRPILHVFMVPSQVEMQDSFAVVIQHGFPDFRDQDRTRDFFVSSTTNCALTCTFSSHLLRTKEVKPLILMVMCYGYRQHAILTSPETKNLHGQREERTRF